MKLHELRQIRQENPHLETIGQVANYIYPTFCFSFTGRTIGAIGIMQNFYKEVKAKTVYLAYESLYSEFEHIMVKSWRVK